MRETRTVAIVGATGRQGGGLARAILADPDSGFSVRALTRNVRSERARELAGLGADVIEADIDDESSLVKALDGAYGAYLVTNFWEHLSPRRETAQAAALARAAERAGVHHAIWSTSEDTRDHVPLDDPRIPTLQSRYKVPHVDAKAEADVLFVDAGIPTTFLRTSFYWENLIDLYPLQRGPDGTLVLRLPMGDSKLAGIAADDIGRTALGIFVRGDEFVGKTVGVAGEHLTGAEMATALTEALGENVVYVPVPVDEFRASGFPAADDVANMFLFFCLFADVFTGARDINRVREINPALQTFDAWLADHKEAFGAL
jgi:uncharacterized protein YbjT (DUF2867 family)